MTTSGTYNFNPNLGELVLYAFNLCGVRNTSILQEHLESARLATNILLAEWANMGVNLWKVDLVSNIPLVEGVGTFAVDPKTVAVLDTYVTINNGISPPVDRIILPVSRTEYASYPIKTQQGFPTVFWFDRLISPTLTLWPVPDGETAQFLSYYRLIQIQDSEFTAGQTVDIPYRWLSAFANGLALQLARMWAPQAVPGLQSFADKSYAIAANQDVETSQIFISPMVSSYYRN